MDAESKLAHKLTLYDTLSLVENLKVNLSSYLQQETTCQSNIKDLQTKLNKSERAWNSLFIDYTELDERHKALQKSHSDLEVSIKGYRIVVLLDGDGAIFALSDIERGVKGGHDAAQRLLRIVTDYLNHTHGTNPYQIWVKLFLNKEGLMYTFGRNDYPAAKCNFDDFLLGLNQASDRFLIVDVGNGKEAADSKIKAHLDDDLRIPQTYKVIFGGCHDNGYVSTLRSLITDRFKDKLILLKSYDDVATGISELELPMIESSGLFLSEKLPQRFVSSVKTLTRSNPSPDPESPPGLPLPSHLVSAKGSPRADQGVAESPLLENQEAEGEWAVVGSPARPRSHSTYSAVAHVPRREPQIVKHSPRLSNVGEAGESTKGVKVDPDRTLAEQKFKKPFCNHHYLNPTGCKHTSDCHYSHDYFGLTSEHFEELRVNAKKNPCPYVNEDLTCPWDVCIYGHVCPSSPKCPFYAKGSCKFQGPTMHKDTKAKAKSKH